VSYELEPEASPSLTGGAAIGTEGAIGSPFGFTFDVTSENDKLSANPAFDVTVTVTLGDTDITVVKAGNNYSFTPAVGGDYWIEVTAEDERGNVSTERKLIFVPVPVTKVALQSAYDTIKPTEKGKYTDASWNELQAKLTAAKAVLDNTNAIQE
jgi:hypothetical protein